MILCCLICLRLKNENGKENDYNYSDANYLKYVELYTDGQYVRLDLEEPTTVIALPTLNCETDIFGREQNR